MLKIVIVRKDRMPVKFTIFYSVNVIWVNIQQLIHLATDVALKLGFWMDRDLMTDQVFAPLVDLFQKKQQAEQNATPTTKQ